MNGMLETVGKYVQKDLDYHKVRPCQEKGDLLRGDDDNKSDCLILAAG